MNKPFLLKPAAKDYLWGGNRVNDDFSKQINMSPLAETWECSTHPEGPSRVASGNYEGMTLTEMLRVHPSFLGIHEETGGQLPILVKLIDAKKDLSVQVHPTDSYAKEHENGQMGKTEMWYVLDATKDAKLVYGMNCTVEKEEMKRAIEEGTVEKYLQKVPVKKDDLFMIEAGTVHAIGAGTLIAEIQENSNLTYRMFDYNRKDKNGRCRQLQVDKALAVANLKKAARPRQPIRVLKYEQGVARELLARCQYFEVYRMLVNTERRQNVVYQTDAVSYHVLLCVGGCGMLSFEGENLQIYKGDCIFVPANSVKIGIHGALQFLDIWG